MKRVVLTVLAISSLFLAGCSVNENNNDILVDNSGNSNLSENISDNNLQENIVNNEEEIINDDSEVSIKKQLISNNNWIATKVWNSIGEPIGLSMYYGSGVSYSNEGFVFKEDDTFSCFVGVWGESDADYRGTYTIDTNNREITFKYNSGNISVAKYRLSENNTVLDLTEEKVGYDGEQVKILFTPNEKENEYLINKFKEELLNNDWVLNTNGTNPEDDGKVLEFNEDGTFYSERGFVLADYHTGKYILFPESKQITLIYEDGITDEILFAEFDENDNILKLTINNANLQNYEYVENNNLSGNKEDNQQEILDKDQELQKVFNAKEYEGTWRTLGDIDKNIEENGGSSLTMKAKNNDTIDFEYTVISSAPANRIAQINLKDIKLDDNHAATFTWEDAWYNKGKGSIKLDSNKVIINIMDTQVDENAMWGISDGEVIFEIKGN